MTLQDKRAIVTGSTRGIGLAIAQALLDEGASVILSSRSEQDVQKLADSLAASAPGRVFGTACDVRSAEQVQRLVQFTVEKLGGLDALVNNAGIGVFKTVEGLTLEEWRDTLATNLDAVFYACHYAIPEMKKGGGGFVINIGSLAGKNAFPHGAAYNASKFGLIGFSEALMQEVRYDDIRVAYLMPGSVDTGFSRRTARESWKLAPEDVAEVVIETLKRDPRCLTSRIEMRPSKPPRK